MLDLHLPRSAASARTLLEAARAHDMDVDDVLASTRLQGADLEPFEAEITGAQELRIIENMVSRLGSTSEAGLEAGLRSTLSSLGMLGFACASAPSLREAMEISLRYQDLAFTLSRTVLVAEDGFTYLEIGTGHLPHQVRAFVADQLMATVWTAFREMGRPPGEVRVELAREDGAELYANALGLHVRTSQPVDRMGFADADLDRPRSMVDSVALRVCEEQCARLLASRKAALGTAGLVRERMSSAGGGVPDMVTIAADLHMSVRNLRRTLAREGTSFRRINEDVRLTRARELLEQGTPVQDVARRLGYSSSSSFVHAFKRWMPTTPGRLKAGAAQGRRGAALMAEKSNKSAPIRMDVSTRAVLTEGTPPS